MTKLLLALLRPGTRLMRDLSIRAKLVTLGLMVTTGIAILVGVALHEHLARRAAWRLELQGARAATALAAVQAQWRQWRLEPAAAPTPSDLPTLADDLAAVAPLLLPRWQQVRPVLVTGDCARRAGSETCLRTARELAALQAALLEQSGLAPSSDTETSLVADLAFDRLPRWAEASVALAHGPLPLDTRAASSRRTGEGAAPAGPAEPLEFTAAERWAVQGGVVHLTDELDNVREAVERLSRSAARGSGAWTAARAASERQVSLMRALALPDAPLANDDTARRRAARDALLALAPLERTWIEALQHRLDDRGRESLRPLWLSAGLGAAVLLWLAYFGLCFQRSVSGSLRAAVRGVSAAAQGDLAHVTRVNGSDEMADLGDALDDMARRLSGTVAEIRTSAVRVGLAGEELAQDSRALHLRTQMQGDRLVDSAAMVARLGRSAGEGAETARSLHQRALQLREQAAQGTQAMHHTMATITGLEDSVRGVAEVTAVIDDIAYQTNMLALNAAVEAAKAGDSGRGFAVVAGEVRQLAARCAESAQAIRGLIDRTTGQVEQSAQAVRGAGSSLDGVAQGAADVAEQLQALAEGNGSNSQDLAQVAEVVGALKELTQENGRAVDRAARAGQALSAEAERLRRSVAGFALRHGSADEALALVQKALDRVSQLGWARTQAAIQQPGSEFADRDLYLFAMDREGVYHAMGARPDLVGRSVRDLAGITEAMADEFMTAALGAAENGGGWIEYTGVNWLDLSHHRKSAYVAAVDDRIFIGCGVDRVTPSGQPDAPAAGAAIAEPALA